MEKTYEARVEGMLDFTWSNEEIRNLDLVPLSDGSFHLIREGKTFLCEVSDVKGNHKHFTVKVNGRIMKVEIRDSLDLLIQKMGMKVSGRKASNDVVAPMPGLILKVLVENGQVLKEGDEVLVLEAMKMENVIKTPAAAKVKEVLVQQGNSAEKGQILILMEPM